MLARKDGIAAFDRYHLESAHQWLVLHRDWGKPNLHRDPVEITRVQKHSSIAIRGEKRPPSADTGAAYSHKDRAESTCQLAFASS
jgi:hypothetical protein